MAFNPAGKGAVGGSTSGESSDKSEESRKTTRLVKSTSMALRERGARKDLNSTHSLVSAYNQSETEEESAVLHEWLRQYSKYINTTLLNYADAGVFEEIACLTGIRPQWEGDKALAKKALFFIGQQVSDISSDQQRIITSLANSLQAIDESVFDGDPSALLNLASVLLSKLDTAQTAFIKATHVTHSATIFALYQTLLTVQRITADVMDSSHTEGIFQTFKTKLRNIAECQSYFPFFFQVKIVEQSLDHLLIDSPPGMIDVKRRVMSALCGCAYVYSGVRRVFMADIDVDSLTKGYERLKDAVASRVDRSVWYDEFVKLKGAALLAAKNTDLEDEFLESFHHARDVEGRLHAKDANLLRFAIVDELHVMALTAKTPALRGFAINQLVFFGTECVVSERWEREPTIVEAILRALEDVYAKVEYKEVAALTVEAMCASENSRVQAITNAWLGGQNLEEKAKTTRCDDSKTSETFYLFHVVRTGLGVYSYGEMLSTVEELKSKYTDPDFVKVEGFLAEERPKSVETFQFHIVYDEEVLVMKTQKIIKDQLAENFQRTQRVRQAVTLEEIFAHRPLKAGGSPISIKRVLLFGNPGTGKTSIAKRVANAWARGSWGFQFNNVYLLSMRALNREAFSDPTNVRAQATLQCAIANICHRPRMKDEEYKVLLKHVEDRLQEDKTLVILDGLDESDEIGKRMLLQTVGLQCGFLLLTRPYNLYEIRAYIQVEMECVGLSDGQLESFVKMELGLQGGGELLDYLETNLSIKQLAHIPVTANVLCFVWIEKRQNRIEGDFESNVFALYQQMVFSVFVRFVKKLGIDLNRDKFFEVLDGIAFEAMTLGQIQISQAIVRKHNGEGFSDKQIEQCGFFLMQKEGTHFQFAHLTFQEFFAGRWLASHFFDKENCKRNEVEMFVHENKYKKKFRVTTVFAMQAICSKYKHDGFVRLLNIAENESKEKVEMEKQVIFVLNVIEAYISSKSEECKQGSFEYPIITRTIEKTVSILREIKNVRRYYFEEDKKQFLREIEHLLESVAQCEDLFIALRDGFQSDDDDCARYMVSIVAKVGKKSRSHAEMLMEFLWEQCTHSNLIIRRRLARVLAVVAKQLVHHHKKIFAMAEAACGDESTDVRRGAVEYLHELAREMPKHLEAILTMAEAACGDESTDVRRGAVEYLHELAREMPNHHEAILAMAETACRDESAGVRRGAVEYLSKLAREMPDYHKAILEMAKETFRDGSKHVRREAVLYFPELAREMPDGHEAILAMAKRACGDESIDVRRGAVIYLPELARKMPDHREEILVMAEGACLDRSEHVRRGAVEYLHELAREMPDRHEAILVMAKRACRDGSEHVRRGEAEYLHRLAREMPDRHEAILTMAERACQDVSADVREGAVKYLHELAREMSGRHEAILAMAKEACRDGSEHVRRGAAEYLHRLAREMPDHSEAILAMAEGACRDGSEHVRRGAVVYLPELTRQMPGRHEAILAMAKEACRDGSEYVRRGAVKQIHQLAKEMPNCHEAILAMAECACQDGSENVRREAVLYFPELAREMPNHHEAIFALARTLCGDDDVYVKDIAKGVVAILKMLQ